MAVVVLTFTASEEEISSGIPKFIEIEANVPATIYYTIDGTTPNINSPIYIEPIQVPTNINSLTLSAFGVDSDDQASSILTQFFAPNTTKITVSRLVNKEGFVIDRFNYGKDISTGFDAEGNEARFVDVDPSTLNIIQSDRGFEGLTDGLAIKVNVPDPKDTPYPFDDNFQEFSSTEKSEFFNPYAKVILIDDRKENEVEIMPRPYGSMSNVYEEFGGKRLRGGSESNYVSGGFVRRFYDARNNIMVGYYFDHNETRYVKNIQQLPDNLPNIYFGNYKIPLVFQWLDHGKQSSY